MDLEGDSGSDVMTGFWTIPSPFFEIVLYTSQNQNVIIPKKNYPDLAGFLYKKD